jgi:hypothetical protein
MGVSTKRIVPLDCGASYLLASRLVAKEHMKLPSNVLHDDYLTNGQKWEAIRQIYPAWAREILVYPEKGGSFVKREDVIDCRTEWALPAQFLTDPKYVDGDVFRPGVGLLVDPAYFDQMSGRVFVIALSVKVIFPFIQVSNAGGLLEKRTCIPLDVQASGEEARWLYLVDGIGVRPIMRECDDCNGKWRIHASVSPDMVFGVAGEAAAGTSENKK